MFLVSDDTPKMIQKICTKHVVWKYKVFFAFLQPIPKPDVAPMAFFI